MEHVDPMKEAKAAATRIDSMTSNLAIECAKNGRDWEDVLKQAAKERQRMIDLGLDIPDSTKTNLENEKDDEEDDTDEADAAPEPDPPRRKKRRRSDEP